jgi:hypothetical protein
MSSTRRTDDGHQYTIKSHRRSRRVYDTVNAPNRTLTTYGDGDASRRFVVNVPNRTSTTYCDGDASRPFYEVVVIDQEIEVKVGTRNRWISHLIEQEASNSSQMLKWINEWSTSQLLAQSLFVKLLSDYYWYFERNLVRFIFAARSS